MNLPDFQNKVQGSPSSPRVCGWSVSGCVAKALSRQPPTCRRRILLLFFMLLLFGSTENWPVFVESSFFIWKMKKKPAFPFSTEGSPKVLGKRWSGFGSLIDSSSRFKRPREPSFVLQDLAGMLPSPGSLPESPGLVTLPSASPPGSLSTWLRSLLPGSLSYDFMTSRACLLLSSCIQAQAGPVCMSQPPSSRRREEPVATSFGVTVADLWPGLCAWVSVPSGPFSDPFPLFCLVPHSILLLGCLGQRFWRKTTAPTISFSFLPGLVQSWARLSFFLPTLFTAKSLLPPRCPLSLGSEALPECPGGPSSLSTHSSNPVTTTGDTRHIPGLAANGVKRNRMSQGPAQPPAAPGPLPGLDRLGVGVRGQEGRTSWERQRGAPGRGREVFTPQ